MSTNLWSRKVKQSHLLNPSNSMPRYDKIYVGVVMGNDDPENMGRLFVYIPEISGAIADPNGWFLVNYASPFAGATNAWPDLNTGERGNKRDGRTHDDTQKSYGFWATPPDLNNQVLVAFASGNPQRGYWFACLYQKDMNHMVPGIARGHSYQGDENGVQQPVSEYNKDQSQPSAATTHIRPAHPMRDAIKAQGLSVDGLRGVTSSSARRESPSRVVGLLTPGGSQFVMDDGDVAETNSFIRLRTVSGAQVLISETYGHVYLITKDGKSWLELNNDGNIDVYSALSINLHGETNVNVRADQDLNFEAGRNINMKAIDGDFKLHASAGIHMNSETSVLITAQGTGELKFDNGLKMTALNLDLKVDQDRKIYIGGDTHIRHPTGGTRDWGSAKTYTLITPCIVPEEEVITCASIDEPDAAGNAAIPTVTPLTLNKTVTTSITSRVPEHEPWAPHTVAAPGAAREAYEPTFDPAKYQDLEEEDSPNDGCGDPQDVRTLATSNRGKLFILSFRDNIFTPSSVKESDTEYRIGYITTGSLEEQIVNYKWGITEEEAWTAFERSLRQNAETVVRSQIEANISQEKFDALVSLVYELGVGALTLAIEDVRLRDLVNESNHTAAAAHIQQLGGNTDRRRRESVLYSACNYGNIGDRCSWLKKGITTTNNSYISQSENIKRQMQGAMYRMNEKTLPGGEDYLTELRLKYPLETVQTYKSQCIVNKVAQHTGSGTIVTDDDIPIGVNFTLKDFVKSDTARAAGISNYPTESEIENLKALAINVIDPLIANMPGIRGIKINSGYRSPALNSYMSGSRSDVAKRSQHSRGQAVDFVPIGVTTKAAAEWIRDNLQFDQLIHESRNTRWVHVSWNRAGNRPDDGRTKIMSWNTSSGVKYYGQIVNV